ncbi:hypothetical protein PO124_30585 [Bacillus licheniformis]|nr:hypothetical protein [Bacillus licheniformis]
MIKAELQASAAVCFAKLAETAAQPRNAISTAGSKCRKHSISRRLS